MIEFFLSNLHWFWLVMTFIFLVFEALTFMLTTLWAALASFFLIFISLTPLAFKFQLLIFFILTILFVVFTRPFAVKKLKLGSFATNVNSIKGQKVIVQSAISPLKKGSVKSINGVIWSAELSSEVKEKIAAGSVCIVTDVKGNTLFVKPFEE